MDLFDDTGAEFSECKKYRYMLWRIWDKDKPLIMFVGLNPSTANQVSDDPTIRRVKRFASDWGYGGVYMMNCFPYVSTNPENLRENGKDELNDRCLKMVGKKCEKIIFAWGSFDIVKEMGRDKELKEMFPNAEALIINQDGSPRHPLYVKSNTKPVNYGRK